MGVMSVAGRPVKSDLQLVGLDLGTGSEICVDVLVPDLVSNVSML